ncbi:L-serine ammonia-lyase, iron-sulfur-dependent, subunit alpha [Clostridium sp.]|uniref:L-cysteine desulfidase family protein n=1 Tax=Clostridium sp. TaxID=1506 RepID=UPI003216446A
MKKLTEIIKMDMVQSLGVTEPGAIAFATARARSYTKGEVKEINIYLNSGIYKNAFTCGIPNSTQVGNIFSAALGAVAGKWEKGLLSLEGINEEDNKKAQKLIDKHKVFAHLDRIDSEIYIRVIVETDKDTCEVIVKNHHTDIYEIKLNNNIIFKIEDNKIKDKENISEEEISEITNYTLEDFYNYCSTVDIDEISFLKDAYTVNMELFKEGLYSNRTKIVKQLIRSNNDEVKSKDEVKTSQVLTGGAIEARVIGLNKPAMSITGSGAHGIICTMPLYSSYSVNELTEEQLLRATALSYLITMYIKEYSGRLSAFCGCAIAAGTGMACALVFMKNGTLEQMKYTINNMASSITGMICDGGNVGCVMKGIVAVDAAYRSIELAMNNIYIEDIHGINGKTPEETMRYMGMIASPGMKETEKTILDIFTQKSNNGLKAT